MPALPAVPSASDLRARLAALPLDPVPLRRAAILGVLLIGLLIAGRVFAPSPRMAADRYDAPVATEDVSVREGPAATAAQTRSPRASAPRPAAPRPTWTGGRVLALVLLAAGAAGAFLLRRRGAGTGGRTAPAGSIEVLGTHALAPGQTLRLVACGDDVLLLGGGTEGLRLLRHWPRETFGQQPISFADVLGDATTETPAAPQDAADARLGEETRPVETVPEARTPEPMPSVPTRAVRGVLFPAPAPRQFHVADA